MKLIVTVIIGLVVAVITLAVMFLFFSGWDFLRMKNSFISTFFGTNEANDLEKVDYGAFLKYVTSYGQSCGPLTNTSLKLYVVDSGNLTKARVFQSFKDLGWCESLQSAENGCGEGESISMHNFTLPSIVRVTCVNSTVVIT